MYGTPASKKSALLSRLNPAVGMACLGGQPIAIECIERQVVGRVWGHETYFDAKACIEATKASQWQGGFVKQRGWRIWAQGVAPVCTEIVPCCKRIVTLQAVIFGKVSIERVVCMMAGGVTTAWSMSDTPVIFGQTTEATSLRGIVIAIYAFWVH